MSSPLPPKSNFGYIPTMNGLHVWTLFVATRLCEAISRYLFEFCWHNVLPYWTACLIRTNWITILSSPYLWGPEWLKRRHHPPRRSGYAYPADEPCKLFPCCFVEFATEFTDAFNTQLQGGHYKASMRVNSNKQSFFLCSGRATLSIISAEKLQQNNGLDF